MRRFLLLCPLLLALASPALAMAQIFNTFNVHPPAPIIISLINASPGSTTAIISWTTNIPGDSTVNYGLTNAYGSTVNDATQTLRHSITLTGLTAATTYHYDVASTDGNTSATSSDQTFTTGANIAAGTSGGTADCPYDTYASDPCGSTTIGLQKASDMLTTLNGYAQSGQSYTTTISGTIQNSQLTVATASAGPLACSTATDGLCHQTVKGTNTGVSLPAGVYIKSLISSGGGNNVYQLSGTGANFPTTTFTFIKRKPANICYLDYGCGANTAGSGDAYDPAKINWSGTGCTYYSDSKVAPTYRSVLATVPGIGTDDPILICGTTGYAAVQHVDLSSNGTHNCVTVKFAPMPTHDLTIKDIRFDQTNPCFNFIPGANSGTLISVASGTGSYAVDLENVTYFGHGIDAGGLCPVGGATYPGNVCSTNTTTTGIAQLFSFTTTGNITIKNYYAKDVPTNIHGSLSGGTCPSIAPSNTDTFQGVAIDGSAIRIPPGHAIMFTTTGCYGTLDIGYNLYQIPGNQLQGTMTDVQSFDPNGGQINGNVSFHDNMVIANPIGGYLGGTQTITYDIDSSTGTLTVHGATQESAGMVINATDVSLYQSLGSHQWTYDCGRNGVLGQYTECPNASSGIGVWAPARPSATITGKSGQLFDTAAGYIAGPVHATYNVLSYTGNWVDMTGTTGNGSTYPNPWSNAGGTCVSSNASNNVTMTAAAAAQANTRTTVAACP